MALMVWLTAVSAARECWFLMHSVPGRRKRSLHRGMAMWCAWHHGPHHVRGLSTASQYWALIGPHRAFLDGVFPSFPGPFDWGGGDCGVDALQQWAAEERAHGEKKGGGGALHMARAVGGAQLQLFDTP